MEYTPLEIEGEDVAEELSSIVNTASSGHARSGSVANVSLKKKRRKSPDVIAAEQVKQRGNKQTNKQKKKKPKN